MKLIGMLDSPYVRRVAISLLRLDLPFEHQALSVFRTFDAFRAINPVVKAPTLVCDDGTVLMDSTLLLDYAEALAGRSLMPAGLAERRRALRQLGLALAACEKSVQIVYELNLRPPERQHEPWLARVRGQLQDAYAALEEEFERGAPAGGEGIGQAGITCAVAWQFTQQTVPEALAGRFPRQRAFAAAAEALPAFAAAPYGNGTVARG